MGTTAGKMCKRPQWAKHVADTAVRMVAACMV